MNILTNISRNYGPDGTMYTTLTLCDNNSSLISENIERYLGQPITISAGYTEEMIWEQQTLTYDNCNINIDYAKVGRVELEFIE